MIPKKLHLVWLGEPVSRPDAWIETWPNINPDYDVRMWGDADLTLGGWQAGDAMQALLRHDPSGAMEVMRYEILHREGGVAVDARSIARAPLADLLLKAPAFACWADELDELGVISTALLGSEPGSEFFARLLADVRGAESLTDRPSRLSVGDLRLTKTWRATRFPLTIHPSHYMTPVQDGDRVYRGSGLVFAERMLPGHPPQRELSPLERAEAAEAAEASETAEASEAVEGSKTVETPMPTTLADLAARLTVSADRVEEDFTRLAQQVTVAPTALLAWPTPSASTTPPALPTPSASTTRFRVLVATDWSSATVPLAALTAYAAMIPPDAPVTLVFAVPTSPGEADLAAVEAIFSGLEEGTQTAEVRLESFDEATQQSCYAALIPGDDPDVLLVDLGRFCTVLHHLALVVRDAERLAAEPAPQDGFNGGLDRRLRAFTASMHA